jgi:hypothetical protein
MAQKDIIVVEDSPNDNGYLKKAAKTYPKAIRAKSKADMVKKVLAALKPKDCIKNLMLVGHGDEGVIGVGDGTGREDCKEIDGKPDWKEALKPLKARFCKAGRIVLFGCHVGACDKGSAKLYEIAKEFGVVVEAPTGFTYGDGSQEPGSQTQVATPSEKPDCIPRPGNSGQQDKKKVKKMRKKPVETRGFKAMAVVSPFDLPEISVARLEFPITDRKVINDFFSTVDFRTAVDGRESGTKFNAHIFVKRDNRTIRFDVCGHFTFLLQPGRWRELHPIKTRGQELLQALMANSRS